MKIIIELDEKTYNKLTHAEFDANLVVNKMREAIANGIPIPKGHGRLIDADALVDSLDTSDRDIYCKDVIEEDAPTIIEADRRVKKNEICIHRSKCRRIKIK